MSFDFSVLQGLGLGGFKIKGTLLGHRIFGFTSQILGSSKRPPLIWGNFQSSEITI